MRDEYRVRLLSTSKPELPGVIRTGKDCTVSLTYGGTVIERSDRDYFESLCRIREALELEGYRPHCYGASRNVFPSGMQRQDGGGDIAYRLSMGRRAGSEDVVDIFESGEDVVPASVSEQHAFFQQWLRSL